MTILCNNTVKEYVGKYYTNYNFAYVGEHFSKSFLEWNDNFVKEIVNAYQTCSTLYSGRISTIKSVFYRLPNGEIIMYITHIMFNPMLITSIMHQSHAERISNGLQSTPPPLVASTKRVSDYSYYNNGGTYNGHTIDIVKKRTSSKRKPQFNYYDRNTRAIMFDYDFYSPFPFENNEADAWATDGHKYRLPMMQFLEQQRSINNIISETINQYLQRELIA